MGKFKIWHSNTGFTLIELLIYIAILSTMIIVVTNIFLIFNKGRGQAEAKSEVNSNFHFVMEKMKRDIASAAALNTPAAAGASSALLDITVAGDSVKYAITNNRITRQIGAQAVEYITSDSVNISSLNFERLENVNTIFNKKRISIEITISGAYNSSSPDWQYSHNEKTTVDFNQDF